ncbi:MAG: hypothetical protein KDA58_12645, partial [Planctomycetaceae bacterium]|nr:hypothetical protein [Planctomycetaceae bacterium]
MFMNRRNNKLNRWFGTAAFVVTACVAARAYDDAEAPEVGLNGVIAAFPPLDLDEDELKPVLDELDNSWQEWGTETAAAIKDFYEGDHPTIESQRLALARLEVKLETMEKALKDSRYESVHTEIAELHGRLAPRVAVAAAILETLTIDPEVARRKRVSGSLAQLRSAVQQVRSDVSHFRGGSQWIEWASLNDVSRVANGGDVTGDDQLVLAKVQNKLAKRGEYEGEVRDFVSRESFLALEDALIATLNAANTDTAENQAAAREFLITLTEALDKFDEDPSGEAGVTIRELFDDAANHLADGGEYVRAALQAYYLNYNVRLSISEGLLQRLISESRQEQEWINECIMSAHVTGWQCTNASVMADVVPSGNAARICLILSGDVRANTQGSVPQATVYSTGYHTFHAEKAINFDGFNFSTEPASVSATANTRNYDAVTKFSRIPILGAIADNIALNKADEKIGQANWMTIQRIRSEVSRQLDSQTDDQFANASLELENKAYGPLRRQGLFPQTLQVSSTNDAIHYESRLLGPHELAGSRTPPSVARSSRGLSIQVHESALTNGSERIGLNGKTMTDAELRTLIEDRMTELLGRDVDVPEPDKTDEETTNTLIFGDTDAVRFIVDQGELTLVLRAGLKRDAGDIPVQLITVPMSLSITDEGIAMKRGQVGVKPLPGQPPANVAEQVARA